MSVLVKNYIQARGDLRLEKFDKESEKQEEQDGGRLLLRAAEAARFDTATWLEDAASRAKQISFVTHPIKYSHSDAKGSSIYETGAKQTWPYLCTTTLQTPRSDVVGNAAALDVAGLLQLEADGENLASQIARGDLTALQPFAKDESQLAQWQQGFQMALADKELRTHTLAKQLYFPVSRDAYHLISPLFSSALAQALYDRVTESRYSDSAKAVRKLKREGKWSGQITVDYLNVAVQTFGGTKPQNISLLNSGRRGQSFLLSCRPPVWRSMAKPPADKKDAFWREFSRRSRWVTQAMKNDLLKRADKDGSKSFRDKRKARLNDLIEILLQYAAEIQLMGEQYPGWSAKSQLSKAEQLWLDPQRARLDAGFNAEYAAKDWHSEIAAQFASWLNFHLKDEKLVMKDAEYLEWQNSMEKILARLPADIKELAA